MTGADDPESLRKSIDELPAQLDGFMARLDTSFPCSRGSEKCHCCESTVASDCQSRLCGCIVELFDFMLLQFRAEGRAMLIARAGRDEGRSFDEHSEAHGDMTARLARLAHGEIPFQTARLELLELLRFWKDQHLPAFDVRLAKALIRGRTAATGSQDTPGPAGNYSIG
jgi:hypothetical protein